MVAKKDHKLDIFDVMTAIDLRRKNFYAEQSAETQKGFVPSVSLRWASAVQGAQAEQYIVFANEFANANFHDLYEHPELQFKLLTLIGCGKSQRHQWIPIAKQNRAQSTIHNFVAGFYPLASDKEIDMLVGKFDTQSFEDFVNRSGCSPEEAKDIIGTFSKTYGGKKA